MRGVCVETGHYAPCTGLGIPHLWGTLESEQHLNPSRVLGTKVE